MLAPYLQLPRAVYVLCLGTLVNRAGALVIPFLTLYLSEKLGKGPAFATTAMGLFGAGSIAASLIGGHLADAIGRRWVMIFALAGGAGLLTFFGSLESTGAVLAWIFGFALITDMYRPAASAMLADLCPPQQRTHAFAMMYLAINLGFAVAPLIGGALVKIAYHWLFYVDAITTGCYALIIFLAIKETLPSRTAGAPGAHQAAGESDDGEASVSSRVAAGYILRDRPFLLLCGGALLVGMAYMQALSTFPLHLGSLGIGPDVYGRIIACNGVMIVCFQILVTAVVTRFDALRVLALAAVITGIGFGAMGLVRSPWLFAGCVGIFTIGEMMAMPVYNTLVSDLAPTALRGRYMGAFGMCFGSANTLGAPLGGLVLASLGAGVLWAVTFAVCCVAAGLFIGIRYAPPPPSFASFAGAEASRLADSEPAG